MTGRCEYCGRPATHVVSYRNGSYGPFHAPVCRRHVSAAEGRVHPGHIATEEIGR